jgi:hypothetical protein
MTTGASLLHGKMRVSEQGHTYSTFIDNELKAERDRRATLDAKGLSIVTTAGTFTTLLAAVGAFISNRQGFMLPEEAVSPLVATLCAFVIAAALGLLASTGRHYQITTPDTLAVMLTAHWQDNEVDAKNSVSVLNVKTIASLRFGNNRKVALIIAATAIQVIGLVSLSITVFLLLN